MRMLIRTTSMQLLVRGTISAKFVIYHPLENGLEPMLWAESQEFNDIFLVECIENMNNGKTIDFLKIVQHQFPGYSYYGKVDIDSYVAFHNLAFALASAPRCRFYGGRSNFPYWNQEIRFISGSMYILSADIVKFFQHCDDLCQNTTSELEDLQIGEIIQREWGLNYFFADFGPTNTVLYHLDPSDAPIMPWTIQVHHLKTMDTWWEIHSRFVKLLNANNVEQAFRRYYIDGPDSRPWKGQCSTG